MKKVVIALIILITLIFGVTLGLNVKQVTYNGESKLDIFVTNKYIEDIISRTKIEFVDVNGDKTEVTLNELGIKPGVESRNIGLFNVNIDTLEVDYDFSSLSTNLEKLNENRTDSIPARIDKTENGIEFVTEVLGNKINTGDLAKSVVNILEINSSNKIYKLTLNLDKYYLDTEQDWSLESVVDTFNKFNITYSNGYEVKLNDYIDYFEIKDDMIEFNKNKEAELKSLLKEVLTKELDSYNTIKNGYTFKTHSGEEIKIVGGNYGTEVDFEKEIDFVKDSIMNYTKYINEERLPELSQSNGVEIGDKYVEVSLDEQHVWFYNNGELVGDADVVTGTLNRNDTPVGVWYVNLMVDGKYLIGPTWKAWVDKWMRFTFDGVGLHDASWRDEFGGEIYKRDGSHGCVNLPKDFAYMLFDNLELGDCIVVY